MPPQTRWAASILHLYSRFISNLFSLAPASLTTTTKALLTLQVDLWQTLCRIEKTPKYRLAATRAFRNVLHQSGAEHAKMVLDWVVANLNPDSWNCSLLVEPSVNASPNLETTVVVCD